MTSTRRIGWAAPLIGLVALHTAWPLTLRAEAAPEENRLRRIGVVQRHGYSRINLFFKSPPDYTITLVPGELRLTVQGADSPSFRKWRSLNDPFVAGVFCARRGDALRVVLPLKQKAPGVQAVSCAEGAVLSLDIGPAVKRVTVPDIAPGREPILSGAEELVREFSVSARGLPFAPTDVKLLRQLLPEEGARLFRQGEGHLYREQGKEAAEIFTAFLRGDHSLGAQALARYRLGEALHVLERDEEALSAFREGEALWPRYLEQAPQLMQSYAEVRAQTGDYRGARLLLLRLVDQAIGTVYLPPLVNLLAGLTERHGAEEAALALYRVVAERAAGTPAGARASMKLADLQMFSLSRDRYPQLLRRYRSLYEGAGEFALRDEALFKMALLQGLYAPAPQALAAATSYDRRYPRGIFSVLVRKMREELLLPVYRESLPEKKPGELARLALEQRDYLARCFSDPEFPPRLARSFREAGMLTRELELFLYLADRGFAAPAAPYLAARVVEDALCLGQMELAESSARRFLDLFPDDPGSRRVREQLGRIAYERKDLKEVIRMLSFLNLPGKKAELPDSDYYLGKALAEAGDQKGAEASLRRFVTSAPAGSPFIRDGYLSLGVARTALREYAGALAAYRQGARLASGEQGDHCLYKMGELYLALGLVRQAAESWETLAARGGEGTWKKLATQALSDMRWRIRIARELP